MGVIKKFVITKEPDLKRTVKKIVTVNAPCTGEMAALMDCFRNKPNVSHTKSTYYSELERLDQAFKRSGF